MRVRMLIKVSGGRGDGTDWPDPGGELDTDVAEGTQLCTAGLAIPVAQKPPVETAVPPVVDVETRADEAPAPNPGPEVLLSSDPPAEPEPEPAPDAEDD